MHLHDCDVCTTSGLSNLRETELMRYLTKTMQHKWSCNVTFKWVTGKRFKFKATQVTTLADALQGAGDENDTGFYMIDQFIFIIPKRNSKVKVVRDPRAEPIYDIVEGCEDDILVHYTKSWRGG